MANNENDELAWAELEKVDLRNQRRRMRYKSNKKEKELEQLDAFFMLKTNFSGSEHETQQP